jgi:NTP pyrophosphatase (non-canonical NTP hydrolase)
MDTFDFEKVVNKHSLMPENGTYNATGLCGECGEVANVIKKIAIRNHLKPEDVLSMKSMDDYKEALNDELGDALFYLTRIALDNGMHLQDIMEIQEEKLQKQSEHYGRHFYK